MSRLLSVPSMDGYVGDAIDSGTFKKYYHGVRILDEIDNRWPHAKKSNAYMKECPYERNPRADIKAPRLVQANQYIRQYR